MFESCTDVMCWETGIFFMQFIVASLQQYYFYFLLMWWSLICMFQSIEGKN